MLAIRQSKQFISYLYNIQYLNSEYPPFGLDSRGVVFEYFHHVVSKSVQRYSFSLKPPNFFTRKIKPPLILGHI